MEIELKQVLKFNKNTQQNDKLGVLLIPNMCIPEELDFFNMAKFPQN